MNKEEVAAMKRQAVLLVLRKARELVSKTERTKPPFSPEDMAPLCGIHRIHRRDLEEVSGLLHPSEAGFTLVLNSRHSTVRQRFTCAHELVHTFFYEEEGKGISKRLALALGPTRYHAFRETLCHLGASEILMPFDIFKSCASKYEFSIYGLAPLAQLFDTSVQATALRIRQVSPKPCQVLMWQQEEDKSAKIRAKLKWVSTSPMRTQGDTGFLKASMIRDEKSSILQAFQQDDPVFSEERLQLPNLNAFCSLESQGFLDGKHRYVITLAFPQET